MCPGRSGTTVATFGALEPEAFLGLNHAYCPFYERPSEQV